MDKTQQEAVAASIRRITDRVGKAADDVAWNTKLLADFFLIDVAGPAPLRLVDQSGSVGRRARR